MRAGHGAWILAAALMAPGAAAAQGRAIRFSEMDRNHDRVITRAEWRGNDRSFRANDWNGDGILSGDEVRMGGSRDARENDENDRFAVLDVNNDRRVTRDEWRGGSRAFEVLDRNGDGVLRRAEMPADLFSSIDTDRSGVITRDEWHWARDSFDLRDVNNDDRITRQEFEHTPAAATNDTARAGYDRGLNDGRAAGREDRERHQGWDLEGQRELETADAGYQPRMGTRADYQAAYREGFRRGYREGFGVS